MRPIIRLRKPMLYPLSYGSLTHRSNVAPIFRTFDMLRWGIAILQGLSIRHRYCVQKGCHRKSERTRPLGCMTVS
jgi:hypothetical protein